MEERVRSCSDLETMKSRAERTGCTQRQMRANRHSKVQSLRESNESNVRNSSSQFFSTSGRGAGDNLGMTRASIDQRKKEFRQTIAAIMQEIRNLQGIIEELHAGVDHSFFKLENKLKNHPENPVAVVQGHMKYFNEVSQQISELYKRIAVLRSEMDKVQQMATPVQKNQERKIGSEVNMEKFSKSRRQRNTSLQQYSPISQYIQIWKEMDMGDIYILVLKYLHLQVNQMLQEH